MARHSLTGIGEAELDKDKLLAVLRANRDKHHDVFERAVVKFREQAIQKLDGIIEQLRQGKTPNLYVGLPVPEEHTDDYDRNIHMLEMHIGGTIMISEEAFLRLVEDDWGWRDAFASNTASYISA